MEGKRDVKALVFFLKSLPKTRQGQKPLQKGKGGVSGLSGLPKGKKPERGRAPIPGKKKLLECCGI